ncbi:hypothetical protein BRD17_04695 [Halobacteriales archaeon SW_7_68_16]|nr:MAG: hypothetical protein BRD17_04695 [Halobacteriales archaeon SW_7_68_16]
MRAGDETFYDVLGVPEDATRAEIEAAYRERVKETHPDAADVDDTDAFRRVVRAEEVLGDPDERDTYDTLGHEAYLRTVDGHDTSTTEHAEWTTGGEGDPATTGRQDAGTSGSGYTGFRDFERHDATVDEGRADPGERGVDPGGAVDAPGGLAASGHTTRAGTRPGRTATDRPAGPVPVLTAG